MILKPGDKVITSKYMGTEVKIDGEQLTIVKQSDVPWQLWKTNFDRRSEGEHILWQRCLVMGKKLVRHWSAVLTSWPILSK